MIKFTGMSYPGGCELYGNTRKIHIFERDGRTKYEIAKKRNYKLNPMLLLFPIFDVALVAAPTIHAFIMEIFPEDIMGNIFDWVPEWAITVISAIITRRKS